MTHLLKRLEPRDVAEELADRSEYERRVFYRKVLNETFRGLSIIFTSVAVALILVMTLFQLFQVNHALEQLDRSETTAHSLTEELKNISVLAAYCAKLPESNTVAKVQSCIEVNLKKGKK